MTTYTTRDLDRIEHRVFVDEVRALAEDAEYVAHVRRHRDWWDLKTDSRLRILSYESGYEDGVADANAVADLLREQLLRERAEAMDTWEPMSAYNRGYRLGLDVGLEVARRERELDALRWFENGGRA